MRWFFYPKVSQTGAPDRSPEMFIWFISIALLVLVLLLIHTLPASAGSALPGEDASSKMESAGTLLRFIDTGIFKWGARVLAGLCIFGAAWNLKEGRFGPAIISVISAILFGTAPTWVRNIFTIGGSDSVFSMRLEPNRGSVSELAEKRGEDSSHV